MRSKNNNVFKFHNYDRTWSRILFHDTGNTAAANPIHRMRADFHIPSNVHTIELDLTAINSTSEHYWRERVQHANIRCHCTAWADRHVVTSVLPEYALAEMRKWLTEDAIDILVHADLLRYMDFAKERKVTNGGAKFVECAADWLTPQQYLSAIRRDAGPGLMMEDIQESYDALSADWAAKIDTMVIKNGLLIKETA